MRSWRGGSARSAGSACASWTHRGAQIAAPKLSSLGLSALDIAALDLSTENVMLSSVAAPETMPGAPNSNPGRQGVARLLLAAGQPGAVTVGFDLTLDAELLDLLDHAAAWQRALAGRRPLSAETFVARAALDSLPTRRASPPPSRRSRPSSAPRRRPR